jgi:dipeptidyl-peptidase-4
MPMPEQNIQYPSFSPDDSKIAFIKENNLFYYNIKNETTVQITKDGRINHIINGKSDWVYEEEFGLTSAYAWNSGGNKIAYLKFDESAVKEYSFPVYGGQAYPQIFSYKYPKVGEANSKISLWYYDLKKKKNIQIPIKNETEDWAAYLPRIYFSNDGVYIYYMLLNRNQNRLTVERYNTQNKKTETVYNEQNNTYINLPDFILLPDNSFLITSTKENYNQIYWHQADGKMIKKITTGDYNVLNITAIDLENQLIYFETNKDKISERQVYSINYKTLETKAITNENGINQVYFAPQLSYYIHRFSNDTTPTQVRILNSNQTSSTILIDNQRLKEKIKHLPTKEFFTIKTDDGAELEAWMIKPQNMDSTAKYPLLMYVYGGPGNQEVVNDYGANGDRWFKFMATQGYVIACVDGRGSGGKTTDFEQIVYLHLGKYETADQINAAKYFSKLGFIDSTRIGIFGWSYGGFLSLNCLAEGNTVFKTAVSVAPVTNWIWYDNIYTERYMQTPLQNKAGYLSYNPLLNASKIKGNLLLIHGTADDNVHIQHTFELMSILNQKNIPYESVIYPDKNHGISGENTRYHLYKKITEFILRKL